MTDENDDFGKKIMKMVDIIIAIVEMLPKNDKINFSKANKLIKKTYLETIPYIRITNINELSTKQEETLSKFKSLTKIEIYCNEPTKGVTFLKKENFINLKELILICQRGVPDFSPLESLKSIRILELYEPNLNDITFLNNKTFIDLRSLNLEGVRQINDYTPLLSLSRLNNLNLYDNNLNDISFINKNYFPSLIELNVGCNPNVSDFSSLSNFETLKKLNLSHNNLNSILFLKEGCLINLTELDLTNNKEINDFSPLKSLIKLEKLYLNRNILNSLNFLSLESFKNLKDLELERCEFNKIENADIIQKLELGLGEGLHYIELKQ